MPEGTSIMLSSCFATVGMMVVSSSIDIITLFVGFELASLSTYALAAFDKSRRNLEAAMKYFIFGSASSALMLFGSPCSTA